MVPRIAPIQKLRLTITRKLRSSAWLCAASLASACLAAPPENPSTTATQSPPTSPSSTSNPKNAEQSPPNALVANLAFRGSTQANVIAAARSVNFAATDKKSLLAKPKFSDQERQALCSISLLIEKHTRFQSAMSAIRLHYALAVCSQAISLNDELQKEISLRLEDQNELIDRGISLADPTALDRARIAANDTQLTLLSKQSQLRSELAALIDPQIACSYSPTELESPSLAIDDLCTFQTLALQQRLDLKAIHQAKHHLPSSSDVAWETALRFWNIPITAPQARNLLGQSILGFNHLRKDTSTPDRRRVLLDQLHRAKTSEIELEVSEAFHARELAAKRWKLAVETTNSWQTRLEQLIALEEVKGTLPQQIESKLEWFQSRGKELERLLEWHMADCDLQSAIGQVGFWNTSLPPTSTNVESKPDKDPLSLEHPSQTEKHGE